MKISEDRIEDLLSRLNKFRVIHKDETKCFGWKGALCNRGFPRISFEGASIGANRAAWMAFHKKDVPKFHYVRHKCGNKKCTNPAHLFPSRNRGPKGKPTQRKSYRKNRESLHLDLPTHLVYGIKNIARKRNVTMTKYMTLLLIRALEIEKSYEATNE